MQVATKEGESCRQKTEHKHNFRKCNEIILIEVNLNCLTLQVYMMTDHEKKSTLGGSRMD
jgi:hypothetical protein